MIESHESHELRELHLSPPTYNRLRRDGILTIEQLADMKHSDLLAIRQLGTKRVEEIYRRLGEFWDREQVL